MSKGLAGVLLALLSFTGMAFTGSANPAWSQCRVVSDDEDVPSHMVEISHVKFDYGSKRLTVRAKFTNLSKYVEYYRFDIRGSGAPWSLGWGHESGVWDDRERVKWFYRTTPTGVKHIKCSVTWVENLDKRVVKVAFASKCLKNKGEPVSRVRMQFSAQDYHEESNLYDWAPGGSSGTGGDPAFTKRIRRG